MEKCSSCGFSFPASDGIPVKLESGEAWLCQSCFDNQVNRAMNRSRASRERLWEIEDELAEGGIDKVNSVRV